MSDRELSRHLVDAAAPIRRKILADRSRVGPKLAPLLAHIEANLFDPALSVGRMKVACGVRDNSISSEFHAAIGQPPSSYIATCRMETATRLLRGTDLEVWRLSDLLGYSSLQVFSRAFVRWAGLRPSAYRRKARRGGHETVPVQRWPRTESVRSNETVPARRVAIPVRDLLETEAVETLRAQAVWDDIHNRPAVAQAAALRDAARPSAALFEVVHQAARHAGREDRQEGVRIAELALEALPVAEPGRAEETIASLKARAWAWVANARSLAYDVPGTWQAFEMVECWSSGEGKAEVHAEVAYLRACAFKRQGDLAAAAKALDGSIEAGCCAGGARLQAEVAVLRGGLMLELGQPAEAIPALLAVAATLEQVNDDYMRFVVVQTLAGCRAYAGRFDEAKRDMARVRALCVTLAQPNLLAHVVALDGLIARALGDDNAAKRYFREAYERFSSVGALDHAAIAALDLAAIYLERGDRDEARGYAAGAARILARTRQHQESLVALELLRAAVDSDAVTMAAIHAARVRLSRSLPARFQPAGSAK